MSILSTSTITSSSSKVFSFGSTTSTSSSQYSAFSGIKTSQSFLSELLDSEAIYLNELKIIDSKISPLWMKQTTQAAPDFTELIKNIRDIILANKRFYMKLAKCAGNTYAAREFGNILLQWATELEVPYSNYSRCFIPNLNDRKDILANTSITQLLKTLSQSSSYDISLDSLFNAPIQHLKYYQDLYTRFLNIEQNNDFSHAIRNLTTILSISQKQLASTSETSTLPQQTYSQHKISTSTCKKKSFIGQDEDFFSYYTETDELSPQDSSCDDRDSILDDYGSSLPDNGYYGKDNDEYSTTGDHEDLATIQPRTVKILNAVSPDPKVVSVATSTTTASSSPMIKPDTSAQIQMTYIQPATAKVMVLGDDSLDDDQQQELLSVTPNNTKNTSTKTLAPDLASTPTFTKMHIPNPTPAPSSHPSSKSVDTPGASLTTPPPQKTLSPGPSEPSRPISPRAVQVQHAVKPVAAMQAVPQKTDDYFGISSTKSPTKPLPARKESANASLPERSSSATPGATVLPRTSSIRKSTRNIDSASPSSIQQTSAMSSQSPHLPHPQTPSSNINGQSIGGSVPLLRSSSLKSTEQLGHSTYPPRKDSNDTLPPRKDSNGTLPSQKDSNDARPTSNRSTSFATSATYHRHAQTPTVQQQPYTPQQEDDQQNNIRQVLYSNNLCEVFHWKDQSWYAVDGQCTVQVRLTFGGRSNVAVQLQPSGQLYLNIWILPNMVVGQPSPTDISISATMMEQQENYLIHFTHPTDASNLLAMLHRMHHEASRQPPPSSQTPLSSSSPTIQRQRQRQQNRPEAAAAAAIELRDDTPSVEDVPQTLKPIYQCKCKLFVQNETSKWNPLGTTAMRISHQLPSQKTHVHIEDDKNNLISSIVRSGNVERLTNKRITFLLNDDKDKPSMIYMIQLKDEQNGNRVFDYLKTQNAAHGW